MLLATRQLASIRIFFASKHVDDRHKYDLNIQHRCPVFKIPPVMFDPFCHQYRIRCGAPVSIYLCPSTDTWFNIMPDHVFFDNRAVRFGMCQHMGPGAYDAHFPLEHIEELRKFIQVGSSQEFPNGGDAAIVPYGLPLVAIGIDIHAAEFVAIERFVVSATA